VIVEPIGRVESSRTQAIDDDWDAVTAKITLDGEQFSPDAVAGLGEFSHVEVVFLFDGVDPDDIEHGARHRTGSA